MEAARDFLAADEPVPSPRSTVDCGTQPALDSQPHRLAQRVLFESCATARVVARKVAAMTVVGLLILLVVAVVAVVVVLTGGDAATVGFDWFEIDTDVTGVFLAGVGCVVFAVLGLWLLKVGLSRSSQRRAEMRSLRKKAEAAEKQRHIESSGSRAPGSTPSPSASVSPPPSSPVDSSQRQRPSSAPPSTASTATPRSSGASSRPDEGPDEYFDTAPREK